MDKMGKLNQGKEELIMGANQSTEEKRATVQKREKIN